MRLYSPAFQDEGMIPVKYTCKGEDISPPLNWDGVPEGTKSLTLVVDDPDAPMRTWDHWVIFNIPVDATGLSEHISKNPELANGTRQGRNSWGKIGYGGPCPPAGTHRYIFHLYALNTLLDLKPGVEKNEVLKAMRGHILSEVQLLGRFKK